MVVALQTIASRNVDPFQSVVVTVGTLHAGTAHNIIPDAATIEGTIRTLDRGARESVLARFQTLVKQTAAAHGATAEIQMNNPADEPEPVAAGVSKVAAVRGSAPDVTSGLTPAGREKPADSGSPARPARLLTPSAAAYPVLVNDPRAAALVRAAACDVVGADRVVESGPSMGGEDFAFFAERVPAAFWRLGVRQDGPAAQPTLHQSTYDFPDAAIPLGIRVHCEIARRFLESGP